MRIGLDATPLIKPAGGIPRYVTELALALARRFPADELHLLSDQPGLHLDSRLTAETNVIYEPPARSMFLGKWWSVGLPMVLKRKKIDVFHGTDFAVPYLPFTPSVMTVHDLSPWMPEPIRPPGSDRVRHRAPKLFGLAKRIITPTQAVAGQLADRFSIPPAKISAILHAARSDYQRPLDDVVTERLQLLGVPEPYLLYTGSREPRKNLAMLEGVIGRVREKRPDAFLVECGPGIPLEALPPGVMHLGAVSEQDLSALLSRASAFLYPSLYEGFGLPVLEAMQAGTPVLASNDPAVAEAAGGAALLLDARADQLWAAEVSRLLTDPEWASELRQKGKARAAQLTWERTAEHTRAIYERAIRGD